MNVTQKDNKISQSIDDTRQVITDNFALEAEAKALNESLALERKATQDLIFSINKYTETSEQEKLLLQANNKGLEKQITLLEKKNKRAETAGWIKLVLGVAIGVAVAQ